MANLVIEQLFGGQSFNESALLCKAEELLRVSRSPSFEFSQDVLRLASRHRAKTDSAGIGN